MKLSHPTIEQYRAAITRVLTVARSRDKVSTSAKGCCQGAIAVHGKGLPQQCGAQ